MASLHGDLEILPFSDLLQHLVTNDRFGTMVVRLGQHQKVIHVGEEGLRLLSTTTRRTNSLGEIMLRTKKVSRQQLDQILEEQQKSGVRLGEIVRRRGLITQKDLTVALREQAEEEIYDLFLWHRAAFEFQDGPPPQNLLNNPMAGAVIDSNPASIMLEAARRADELEMIKKVIPDGDLIPVKTGKTDARNLGVDEDLARSVYRAVNGKNTADQVIRLSLYPRFDALRALYVLVKSDLVKILNQRGTKTVRMPSETRVLRKKPEKVAGRAATAAKTEEGTLILLGDLLTYRTALATLLRDSGYEVIEEAAAGAVRLLSGGRKVDVAILDVALDNPAGYDFCTWLSENLGAPIIVLSSDPSEEAVQNAVSAGASNYVIKPFTRDTILTAIREVRAGSSPAARPSTSG